MSQSLAKILIHSIFSTKHRATFLKEKNVREETHAYLGGVAKTLGCQPLTVGGVEDHVHLLTTLSRTLTLSDLIKELKRVSNQWVQSRGGQYDEFQWQAGYGAFSIGESQIDRVQKYIQEQEAHHQKMTFQEELRELLRRYHVPFDERYIWD